MQVNYRSKGSAGVHGSRQSATEPPDTTRDSLIDEAAIRQKQLLPLMMATGDCKAFSKLYDLTIDRVYAVVVRIVGDPSDAEEVVCDVYFHIWSKSSQYQPARGDVLAWMTVIARSRALDAVRRRNRIRQQEAAFRDEMLFSGTEIVRDGQYLTSLVEGNVRLQETLGKLPLLQQQLLELNYILGMSHSEIATQLSMPLGTVKSHLRRTMSRVREQVVT
jgi:RNA polymerase sigma-70 factor (ECF subfamily)